jgi:hypothetical protein
VAYVARNRALSFVVAGLCALSCISPAPAFAAIVFGQLDDFQGGTTMGWSEGFPSPNPPENVATGGPGGAADRFLRNVSSGGFGAGSKQVMFNTNQWAGNYNAAGITRISAWVANFGDTTRQETLHLRLSFASGANQFSSTRSVDLPPDGVWRRVHFDLTDSALTRVGGSGTAASALSNVTELDLLSSTVPAYRGSAIRGVNAVLGVEDLRAMRPEGDANFDGQVNGADLRIVRSNLGSSPERTWQQGDFNFDGRVNFRDVALLRRNFSGSPAAASAAVSIVPEPAVGALSCAAALLFLRRKRPLRQATPSPPAVRSGRTPGATHTCSRIR